MSSRAPSGSISSISVSIAACELLGELRVSARIISAAETVRAGAWASESPSV